MNATSRHLVRASQFHLIVDKEQRANEYLGDFHDAIDEALSVLTANLAMLARFHDLDPQEADDFMADQIGTVSPIDPIGQSDLPAIIQAALVADHRKGAV